MRALVGSDTCILTAHALVDIANTFIVSILPYHATCLLESHPAVQCSAATAATCAFDKAYAEG